MSDGLPPSQAAPPPFATADEHLRAMLGWLHRLLAWRIAVTQHLFGALADDEYRGLYIPDSEVAVLSAGAPDLPPALAERRQTLAAERAEIEARLRASVAAGISPLGDRRCFPLLRVGQLFGLTVVERDILLLALAPELDLRYERLYAYLQDDVTRKRPTVDSRCACSASTPRETAGRPRRLRSRRAAAPPPPGRARRRGQRQPLAAGAYRQARRPDRRRAARQRRARRRAGALRGESARPSARWTTSLSADAARSAAPDARAAAARAGRCRSRAATARPAPAVAEALCAEVGAPLLVVDTRRSSAGRATARPPS